MLKSCSLQEAGALSESKMLCAIVYSDFRFSSVFMWIVSHKAPAPRAPLGLFFLLCTFLTDELS